MYLCESVFNFPEVIRARGAFTMMQAVGPASLTFGSFVMFCLCFISMASTDPTSLNRLNLGASMKLLGQSYAVSSSFTYDLIFDLPDAKDNHKPEELAHCQNEHAPNNETESDYMKCIWVIHKIRWILREYILTIYEDVKTKIKQIYQIIP